MENKFVYETRRITQLSEENIKDILTSALEGGISYWAVIDNTVNSWIDTHNRLKQERNHVYYCDIAYDIMINGGSIHLEDVEDEEERFDLNLDNFLEGCKIWEQEHEGLSIVRTVEDGEFDSDAGDELIQYALFGELVYG